MQEEKEKQVNENLPAVPEEKGNRILWLLPAMVLVTGIALLVSLSFPEQEKRTGPHPVKLAGEMEERETEPKLVKVTGTGTGQASDAKKKAEPENVEVKVEAENTAGPESNASPETAREQDWKIGIFGEEKNGIVSHIAVSGLTNTEKVQLGFMESDFIRTLSAFLNTQQIRTDKVTFTEKIGCSSEHAVVYRAELSGIGDQALQVIMFPEYTGYYLITLQDSITIEIPEREETDAAPVMPQPSVIYIPQTEQAQENVYDASRLSILGIPDTLLNYIDNRYELQYSMYRYLYAKGDTDITGATVTDYRIDASGRKATIRFVLSNGDELTGTYKKEDNSYSYQ